MPSTTLTTSDVLDFESKRPIAWLLRSWRYELAGGKTEVAEKLASSIVEALQDHGFRNARLSRLETVNSENRLTGQTLRIVATSLGVDEILQEDMVDLFYYLQGNRARLAQSDEDEDVDRLYEVLGHEPVRQAKHWTAIARAFMASPPFLAQSRDRVARPLFDDIKKFKGRSFYALRNAVVMLRDHIAPVTVEELGHDAVRGYHLIEPLGLMGDAGAMQRLLQIVKDDFNTWTSGAILEALRRSKVGTTRLLPKEHRPELRALVLEYMASDNYATQHQAALLGLESFPRDAAIRATIASHHNFDVTNILNPPAALPQELRDIVREIDKLVGNIVPEEPTSKGMRAQLIQQAIFGQSRIDRSEAAWTLSLSPYRNALVTATMQTLVRNTALREEHQRNLVRVIGRVGGPKAPSMLRWIAENANVIESVRVAALWDLPGLISAPQPWLAPMLARERSIKVAAAIVTVGGKIGDAAFLRKAEEDERPAIRMEAQSWG